MLRIISFRTTNEFPLASRHPGPAEITSSEEPSRQTSRNRTGQVTPGQSTASDVRSLAKLVAAGEGERVCDCKGEGDRNERQPDKLEPDHGQHSQGYPQQRLDVDGEPEEAAVGRVDDARGPGAGEVVCVVGGAALEDPVAVACLGVDLVPPAQADEAPAGDVFEVVEVGGEEEDCYDEDHDHVVCEEQAEEVDDETCSSEDEEGQKRYGMRTELPA